MTKFRVFRRAAKEIVSNSKCLFVLALTSSNICDFSKNEFNPTDSESTNDFNQFKPIFEIFFFDDLQSKESKHLTFNQLLNRDYKRSLFTLGRPLWASMINANCELSELFRIAKQSLIGSNKFNAIKEKEVILPVLAMLSSRTTS